jgi:RNA polymerase sigma-70 factor (ECF subfamily)
MPRHDPLAHPEPLIRRVYAYVAYRIGDGPEAEDVTSEVFARALRYRGTYDPAKVEDPAGWLIGIARRAIAESFATRQQPAEELPELADEGDLEERTVVRLRVRGAVATLDERDRELIALRYGADLTSRRIGELLGLGTNTVEVALHRALARLRALLEEDAAAEAPESNPGVRKGPSAPVLRASTREGETR